MLHHGICAWLEWPKWMWARTRWTIGLHTSWLLGVWSLTILTTTIRGKTLLVFSETLSCSFLWLTKVFRAQSHILWVTQVARRSWNLIMTNNSKISINLINQINVFWLYFWTPSTPRGKLLNSPYVHQSDMAMTTELKQWEWNIAVKLEGNHIDSLKKAVQISRDEFNGVKISNMHTWQKSGPTTARLALILSIRSMSFSFIFGLHQFHRLKC